MAKANGTASPTPNQGEAGINEIPLFGSQKLVRDGAAWVFICKNRKPERLTMRESMFINAALKAAGR